MEENSENLKKESSLIGLFLKRRKYDKAK